MRRERERRPTSSYRASTFFDNELSDENNFLCFSDRNKRKIDIESSRKNGSFFVSCLVSFCPVWSRRWYSTFNSYPAVEGLILMFISEKFSFFVIARPPKPAARSFPLFYFHSPCRKLALFARYDIVKCSADSR